MARNYTLVSADSHLDLNPDVWAHRVPARWRDRAPRRVKMPNGSDAVVVDGGAPNTIGVTRSVGIAHKDLAKQVPTFEASAGTGPPEQRLSEQDRDGIEAEIMYSQIQPVLRQAKDDELYVELVRAYNDYLIDEYSSAAPDRLIPMGLIPMTNVTDAVSELERCAKLGFKGVALWRFPNGKARPTAEDDRFWATAIDVRMPLTNHGGSVGQGGPNLDYPKAPGEDVHVKEPLDYFFRFTPDHMRPAVQMAFAGVWDRFPTLEMYWAETMAGWFEYALWQLDDHYDRYMHMIHEFWGLRKLDRQPSEYMRERNYWGFLHDPVAVKRRECIGVDKLMWASDFAHAASDWPNSRKVIEEDFAGVPAGERRAMLVDNCVRYFRL
jgi:predicted TIM-barrel fold metal-dependent hydrolase